jgi:hypothetical protein
LGSTWSESSYVQIVTSVLVAAVVRCGEIIGAYEPIRTLLNDGSACADSCLSLREN